jgi:hypothetical protein
MKPERSAGDQADLGVDLLDPGVGESVIDRGEDPVALLAAERLLNGWLKWARRCRLTPFVKLARTITRSVQVVRLPSAAAGMAANAVMTGAERIQAASAS